METYSSSLENGQRLTTFVEEQCASYGDWNCLNPKYLGIIEISGLKDAATN